jgi:ABC-type enterochelin transport system substrate-binding protein
MQDSNNQKITEVSFEVTGDRLPELILVIRRGLAVSDRQGGISVQFSKKLKKWCSEQEDIQENYPDW